MFHRFCFRSLIHSSTKKIRTYQALPWRREQRKFKNTSEYEKKFWVIFLKRNFWIYSNTWHLQSHNSQKSQWQNYWQPALFYENILYKGILRLGRSRTKNDDLYFFWICMHKKMTWHTNTVSVQLSKSLA